MTRHFIRHEGELIGFSYHIALPSLWLDFYSSTGMVLVGNLDDTTFFLEEYYRSGDLKYIEDLPTWAALSLVP